MSLPVHLVGSLADVSVGSVVEVSGDEAHHAVAVRRLREGEHVVLRLAGELGFAGVERVLTTLRDLADSTEEGVTVDARDLARLHPAALTILRSELAQRGAAHPIRILE